MPAQIAAAPTGGRLSRVLKFQIPASSIKPAVSVIRYDAVQKRYTASETAKVSEKIEEGKRIKYLDLSGVSDWVEVDPDEAAS